MDTTCSKSELSLFSRFFFFFNCLTTYDTNLLTLLFYGFVYYTNTLALFSLSTWVDFFWFDSIQQLSVVFFFFFFCDELIPGDKGQAGEKAAFAWIIGDYLLGL